MRITELACAAPGSDLASYDRMYDLAPEDFSLRPLADGEPQEVHQC